MFVDHNNTVAVQAQGGVVDLQRLARMALILGGAARAVEQQVAREQAQVAAAAAQLAEAAPAAPDA